MGHYEPVRTELPTRCLGEVAAKYCALEWLVSLVRTSHRQYRALYLLNLVSGVLRISAPCYFHERARRASFRIASSFFYHVVQVMSVALRILPRDLPLSIARRARTLEVQIETEFLDDLSQFITDRLFEGVANDLSELVGRRLRQYLSFNP